MFLLFMYVCVNFCMYCYYLAVHVKWVEEMKVGKPTRLIIAP